MLKKNSISTTLNTGWLKYIILFSVYTIYVYTHTGVFTSSRAFGNIRAVPKSHIARAELLSPRQNTNYAPLRHTSLFCPPITGLKKIINFQISFD